MEDSGLEVERWRRIISRTATRAFDLGLPAAIGGLVTMTWHGALLGFLWGGYHRSHGQHMDGSGAFTVHRPEHWIFAGTDLRRGDAFGGKDTIVGYECDGCELVWKDGLPNPTFRDGTPQTFVVLGTAPARWHPDDAEWYDRWENGRTGNAVMEKLVLADAARLKAGHCTRPPTVDTGAGTALTNE